MFRMDAQQSVRRSKEYYDLDHVFHASDADFIYLDDVQQCENENGDVATLLLTPLLDSGSFRALLDDFSSDWKIAFDTLTAGEYFVDEDAKIIIVDRMGMELSTIVQSPYFTNSIRTSILRSLRDAWHENAHQPLYNSLNVESRIKTARARCADIECFVTLCAFETNSSLETTELWRHVLGSENGDMAILFKRSLKESMTEQEEQVTLDHAMQTAFTQWYKDIGRVDSCDHETLNIVDDILMNFDLSKEEKTEFFAQRLKASDLCLMTQRGTTIGSYLGDLNIRILKDPFYADIDDQVNQAHLLQIMQDMNSVRVGDVAFRSEELARKIFPAEEELAFTEV